MKMQCLLIEFEDSTAVTFNFLNEDVEEFFNEIEEIQNQKSELTNFMKANKVVFFTKKFKKSWNYFQEVEEATQMWLNR